MSLRSLSQSSAESEQLQQASVSHSGPGTKRGSQTRPLVTLGGHQEAPRGCGQHDFLHLWPFCASPGLSPHPVGTGNGGETDDRRALPGPPSGLVSHSEGCRPEVRSGEACPSSTAHTGSEVRHALVSPRAPSGSPLQLHGTGQPGGCHVPAAEEQRGGAAGGAGPPRPPPPPRRPTVRGSRVGGLLSGAMSTSWTSQSGKLGQRSEPRGPLRPRAGPRGNVAGRGGGRSGFWKLGALWRRGHRQVRAADSVRVHAWERTRRDQGSGRRSPGGAGSVLQDRRLQEGRSLARKPSSHRARQPPLL